MLTEADTSTRYIVPKLLAAGWDDAPHSFSQEHSFTDGRIFLIGTKVKRKQKKRADFLLQYTRDFTLAVVEAKSEDRPAGEGLQQAKDYAEILGVKFAYATNGHEIIEFDYITGQERVLEAYPSPQELWLRYTQGVGIQPDAEKTLLEPYNQTSGKIPRYYQQIAINRSVQSVLKGRKRILLTMATGTGKTVVAFNIAWKLWQSRWNRTGEYRRPKILFLADRNLLVDAAGWRPSAGDIDRYGREIPDDEYLTKDFERLVSLRKRTEAIAKHLADFMKQNDRFAKTIVFCVDQEHADDMRRALVNLNSDLVQQYPEYVARVTSDEGDIGKNHLSNFQELERSTPVILTTSQLLTTGVDAPTCKNIVLARVINSMTEFKQIIGRGTRVREDAGKLWFSILDYTGSATRLFADPEFDGDPVSEDTTTIDDEGSPVPGTEEEQEPVQPTDEDNRGENDSDAEPPDAGPDGQPVERRKFYFDGGSIEIVHHYVSELDADGNQLRVVKFTDYTKDKVRTLYTSADDLRGKWSDPEQRKLIIQQLEEQGIDFDELASAANQPDADPFDLLCHIAFNAPLKTRRERAERLRKDKKDLFEQFGPKAKEVLKLLLEKYEQHGTAQFVLPDVLQLPPINGFGNVIEIAGLFGGVDHLRTVVNEIQAGLYAV